MRIKIVASALALAFLILGSTSCERDDICSETTPTTPRLVLEFYNNDIISATKAVTLDMYEIGVQDTLAVTSQSKVYVPLRTDGTSSTWVFRINPNSSNPDLIRTDTLTFNYRTNQIFVSRACGYKTNFELNLDSGLPAAVVHTPSAPQAWIRNILIDQYYLETETNAHIRVFW